MAVPNSKQELLDAIEKNFNKLMADLLNVPEELSCNKTMEGHAAGTLISPSDLVSYLIGWNTLVLKWLSLDDNGIKVDFPESGFKWNQLGLLAQKFYEDYRDLSYAQLLESLSEVKKHIIITINNRSDCELYGSPWHTKGAHS